MGIIQINIFKSLKTKAFLKPFGHFLIEKKTLLTQGALLLLAEQSLLAQLVVQDFNNDEDGSWFVNGFKPTGFKYLPVVKY